MTASDFRVGDRLFSALHGFVEVLAVHTGYIVLGRSGRSVASGVRWDDPIIRDCIKPGGWQLLRKVPDIIILPVGA